MSAARRRALRREPAWGAIAVAFFLCAPALAAEPRLWFGIPNIESQEEMKAKYDLLGRYLSRKLGREVMMQPSESDQDLLNRLRDGTVHMARLSAGTYVAGQGQGVAMELVASMGEYQPCILARKDSGIREIRDLKGKVFVYRDRLSYAGYGYSARLISELGYKPEDFFRKMIVSYGYDKSVRSILENNPPSDAAGIRLSDFEGLSEAQRSRLHVFAVSPPMPKGPIVAVRAAGLDVENLRRVLMAMNGDPEGAEILRKLKVKSFSRGRDSDYDPIRRAYAASAPARPAARAAAAFRSEGRQVARERSVVDYTRVSIADVRVMRFIPSSFYDMLPFMGIPFVSVKLTNATGVDLQYCVRVGFKEQFGIAGVPHCPQYSDWGDVLGGDGGPVTIESFHPELSSFLTPNDCDQIPDNGTIATLLLDLQIQNRRKPEGIRDVTGFALFAPPPEIGTVNIQKSRNMYYFLADANGKTHLAFLGLLAWIQRSYKEPEIVDLLNSAQTEFLPKGSRQWSRYGQSGTSPEPGLVRTLGTPVPEQGTRAESIRAGAREDVRAIYEAVRTKLRAPVYRIDDFSLSPDAQPIPYPHELVRLGGGTECVGWTLLFATLALEAGLNPALMVTIQGRSGHVFLGWETAPKSGAYDVLEATMLDPMNREFNFDNAMRRAESYLPRFRGKGGGLRRIDGVKVEEVKGGTISFIIDVRESLERMRERRRGKP